MDGACRVDAGRRTVAKSVLVARTSDRVAIRRRPVRASRREVV
jgi:hypothetical protein